jgi:hypothetical protein
MLLNQWVLELNQAFFGLTTGIIEFLPKLIVALIIFIFGWFIGAVLGRLVAQIVASMRIDDAGFKLNSGAFLGFLVKWFFIILFLIASLQLLGLTDVTLFLSTVVLTYLPHVIVAVLILLVAAVIADAVQKIVAGSAAAVNIGSANFVGSLARWAIWGFAILAALEQVGIATALIQTLFTGLVVALSLAFGLAFGLGGQHAAADYIKKMRDEMK